jgi:hypothetical protein
MTSENNSPWLEAWNALKEDFRAHPVAMSLFWITLPFYVIGYIYNNLQNGNRLFSTSWFYDSIILSWTNLFILPLLLIAVPWRAGNRDWSELKLVAKAHLYSPLVWIFGDLGIRLIYKLLLDLNVIISSILNWLGS